MAGLRCTAGTAQQAQRCVLAAAGDADATEASSVSDRFFFNWLCSKLVITQIIPEDDAVYQCLAESEEGSVLSLARLIVVMSEDRPSAPRNIHAETISSSAILLAWEKPLYNADKVIAYSIHYMKAEGKPWYRNRLPLWRIKAGIDTE